MYHVSFLVVYNFPFVLRYHYIRDMVTHKEVVLKHISTTRMIADPLTKPIGRDAFQAHVKSLGLRRL
jgi:hypothetical protein